jgi:hypothetical protein
LAFTQDFSLWLFQMKKVTKRDADECIGCCRSLKVI